MSEKLLGEMTKDELIDRALELERAVESQCETLQKQAEEIRCQEAAIEELNKRVAILEDDLSCARRDLERCERENGDLKRRVDDTKKEINEFLKILQLMGVTESRCHDLDNASNVIRAFIIKHQNEVWELNEYIKCRLEDLTQAFEAGGIGSRTGE